MTANIGAATGRAWKYSTNLDKLKVFFAFYLVAGAIILLPMITIYSNVSTNALQTPGLIQGFAGMLVGIVVAVLIVLFANLMFTHNYVNQKSLKNSCDAAKSRFVTFLAATILVAVITGIVGIVPLIGFIFSIIAALAFFFVTQEIALSGSGAIDAIKNSYNMFNKNKFDVFITLVVTIILSLFIMLIFAIPLFVVGFLSLFSALSGGTFAAAFTSNAAAFVITGLIALFGVSLGTLFANSMRTDVYTQLKKARSAKANIPAKTFAPKPAPKRTAKKK